ncbi:MAG: hypothetical protein ACM3ZA_07410 [Bacillota bacterium]
MKRWFVIVGGTILVLFVVAGILVPVLTRPRPLAPFNQPEALRQAGSKLDQARNQLRQGRAVVTLSQDEARAVLAAGAARAAGDSLEGLDVSLAVDAEARTLTVPLANLQVGGQPVTLENLTVGRGELTLSLAAR